MAQKAETSPAKSENNCYTIREASGILRLRAYLDPGASILLQPTTEISMNPNDQFRSTCDRVGIPVEQAKELLAILSKEAVEQACLDGAIGIFGMGTFSNPSHSEHQELTWMEWQAESARRGFRYMCASFTE